MKGQNLRIMIGSPAKCVAFATSCTYHLSATLEDASTKDDSGGFQKQEVTGMAGDFSCDALYSVNSDTGAINGSSVGLEHLPYKQRVGGSTPSAPTKKRS